jgi:arginine repressor
MAENTIEIEIELSGQKETVSGLDKIKSSAEGLGEGFKGVTGVMDKASSQIGEGLSTITEAIGPSIDAVGELSEGIGALSKGGVSGFSALIGPIGLVVGALSALYEGYRQLSGAAEEAEMRQEAMAAASADLMSKLEALAEGGVVPAISAMHEFSKATIQSQVAKDLLENQVTKLRPKMEAYSEALEAVTEAQQKKNAVDAKGLRLSEEGLRATENLTYAEAELAKAQGEYEQGLRKLEGPMQKNLEMLAKAAEQEKALEELTTDNLKAKVKEQAERLKALQIAEQELNTQDQLVLTLAKEQIELEAANVARKAEDMSRQELIKTVDQQREAITALAKEDFEIKARSEKAQRAFAEADKKEREAQIKQAQMRAQMAKARQQAQEAEKNREIAQLSQLRQLQIQYTLEGDAQLLALARERYDTGLQLAKDDATKRAIVETQYDLEVRKIREAQVNQALADQDARLAKEKEAAQALRDFRFETAEFNASMIRDEGERELALLQVKYDKELALAEDNQMKRTELQRRYGLERARLEQQSAAKMQEVAEKLVDDYGKGFAQASVGALMFGENFEESIAKVTKSLAMEAGVQALMELAKGTAALLLNPVQASTHFKSAALFGSAALLAKGASSALGGGGGGATGTASPSGSALSAPAPQRQSAEQESMVFNINFGGAVIYDTRRAAEEALADRVATVFNRPRRGAVRPVMMRG